MTVRHAVYLLPGASARDELRDLGEAWLGRRADGTPLPAPTLNGISAAAWTALTARPRRYGFHATVKAPFRLADGVTPETLSDHLSALAAVSDPVVVPDLTLAWLDGFAALVPGTVAPALRALADRVVTELDPLRAPLTADERARRHPERLSSRQRELLERYGYPYVLDEFRLHFTLSDRLEPPDRARVEPELKRFFASQLGRDVPVDALCHFTEPNPGAELVLSGVHPLGARAPGAAPGPSDSR